MLRKLLAAILLMLSGQVSSSEVWYTSNVATPDMPDMFSRPEKWAQTRALVDVIKVYQSQLAADKPGQCRTCGNNIWPTLQSHGMFERLHDWNIHLAMEGGSVKPGDCDAAKNTRAVVALIDKLKKVNTKLYAIAQDQPFVSGLIYCKAQGESKTAYYVKRYADSIKAHYERVWPGEVINIGLIEAYPVFTANEIQEIVERLIHTGYKPAFVHLDFDRNRMVTYRISNARLKHDLLQLRGYLSSYGIPLGIIFWGQDGADKVKSGQNLLDFAMRIKSLYGAPEHIGIQHWDENREQRRVVPDNLSEHQAYTGTNLTLKTLEILNGAR
jgi:hypothetical protein